MTRVAETASDVSEVDRLHLPELNLVDPELKGRRWHRVVRDLLEGGHWLARSPGAVVVLDREAGEFFLHSRAAVFPGRSLAGAPGTEPGPAGIDAGILNLEGEDHRRLRGLMSPSFTPRAVNRRRPDLRRILGQLWIDLPGESFDFVSVLGRPYPVLALASALGVSTVEAPRLHDWSDRLRRQFDPVALADPATVETMKREAREFHAWVEPLIVARRESPGDDLISTMMLTEEDGRRLEDAELASLILSLVVGGVAPVQGQLVHAVRVLADSPEQWEALRADPDRLVPRAVFEILRFEPATPFTARRLTDEIEYRGVRFPAGTTVAICAFAGNRDPDAFERPLEFDPALDRDGSRPLSFGAGIHHCVGADLARAELEEALRFLVDRIERIEPADEPDLQPVTGIYGVDSMEVRITPV